MSGSTSVRSEFVFAVVTHLVLWVMLKQFASMARHTTSTPLTAIARPADASVPQTPRLQPFPMKAQRTGDTMPPNTSTPIVDMQEMRANEEQLLNNPGWVDKQKGIVRLPIEVAKQIAVQRMGQGAKP